MISYTAAQRSVCTYSYIPKVGSDVEKYTYDEMIRRNLTKDPNYILMRSCVHIYAPKLVTENDTMLHTENNSIPNMEKINTSLPIRPLTKSVAMFETISIAITCTITTLTLLYILVRIVRYYCSK